MDHVANFKSVRYCVMDEAQNTQKIREKYSIKHIKNKQIMVKRKKYAEYAPVCILRILRTYALTTLLMVR